MKLYQGYRDNEGELIVSVNGILLNPRTDLKLHYDGFECGYGGVGSRQLALALLADYFDDAQKALALYEKFMWIVIVQLPRERWSLNTHDIETFVRTGVYPPPSQPDGPYFIARFLRKLLVHHRSAVK